MDGLALCRSLGYVSSMAATVTRRLEARMLKWLLSLTAAISLSAVPALAAPCETQGVASAAMAFPNENARDVPFARSMVPAMLPAISGAVPRALTCTRLTVQTAFGDYALGGENGDRFPRMALRADGKAGPVVYLAGSPESPGMFALVVRGRSQAVVKRFYAGVPTDQRLADDVRAALADDAGIMGYDAERKLVGYFFAPPDGVPPPVESGKRADGTDVTAGPQIMILASGDPGLLNMNDHMRHTPSGFLCPQTFQGLAVLLLTVDPQTDSLACSYRAGTDLRYREDEEARYEINLIRSKPGQTARSIFEQMASLARKKLRIIREHVPPLPAGPAPEPEFVGYWDTADAGVQGVWVGKAGGWIVWLGARYSPSPASDDEAGKVARILFAEASKVK